MVDTLYPQSTDNISLPPAKRIRLEPANYDAADMAFTAAGVDDMDDLYGTPVEGSTSATSPHGDECNAPRHPSTTPLSPPMGSIPGLGLISPPAREPPAVHNSSKDGEQERIKIQPVGRSEDHAVDPEGSGLSLASYSTAEVVDTKAQYNMEPVSLATQPEELRDPSVTSQVTADGVPGIRMDSQDHTDIVAEDNGQGEPAVEASRNDPVPTGTSDVPTKTSQLTVGEQVSQSKVADDEEFVRAAEANKDDPSAEWQLDSSDAETSGSSSSSDSDSDTHDDDDDDEGVLLDPEEQARILMREEAADGDIGGPVSKTPLRTANEKPEEKIEKPNVVVTPDMKITELGDVEAMVDNLVLIKGKTSGEYQVLEMGSVLCLADRSVIGAVAETLGRVQEPRYAVGFSNADEVGEAGITKGTVIYYVDQHSTYVFTQPLKSIKGSDASNMHDEEVLGEEIEFSDDEAEAEYKRNLKRAKQVARGESGGRGAHSHIGRVEKRGNSVKADYPTGGINYDDVEDADMYTPLARPENLHEMMSTGKAPVEERNADGRGARGGRGRFGRGRDDRGGRGRRDHDRGGHHTHGNRDTRAPQNRRGNNERFDRGGRRGSDHRQQPHHTSGPKGYGFGTAAQPQDPALERTQVYSPPTNQFQFVPSPSQGSYNWAQGNSPFAMSSVSPPSGSAPPSFTNPNSLPTSSGLPAGAYLNPAFITRPQQFVQGQQFAYSPQQPYQPQYTPQWPASQQQQQQQHMQPMPQHGVSHLHSPDISAAHGKAQDNLAEILRGLAQNTRSL